MCVLQDLNSVSFIPPLKSNFKMVSLVLFVCLFNVGDICCCCWVCLLVFFLFGAPFWEGRFEVFWVGVGILWLFGLVCFWVFCLFVSFGLVFLTVLGFLPFLLSFFPPVN